MKISFQLKKQRKKKARISGKKKYTANILVLYLIKSFTIEKKYITNGLLRWSGDIIEDFLVDHIFCNIIRHVVLVHN